MNPNRSNRSLNRPWTGLTRFDPRPDPNWSPRTLTYPDSEITTRSLKFQIYSIWPLLYNWRLGSFSSISSSPSPSVSLCKFYRPPLKNPSSKPRTPRPSQNHTHLDLHKPRNSPQNTNLAILDSEEELEEEEEELHEAILCWGPGFSHGSRVGASGRQTKAKNGRKSREKKNQRGVDRIEPKAPFLQESGTGARRRTCDCWNSFTSKDER